MMRAMMHRIFAIGLAVLSCACATPADGPPVVLLGEVHDNAAQHLLRLQAFEALLAGGARPAVLMEQFDREHQIDIDRVRFASPGPDADALIAAAAGSPSWNWAFYRPFVELALAYDLPLVAANVSRRDARQVMEKGLAPNGFHADVPADIENAQAAEIEASHCGLIDAAQAKKMAAAQIARDQFMAHMIEVHAGRGVVLLAGNAHVRKDIGVPRWLSARTRVHATVVGYLEAGQGPSTGYDRVHLAAAQARQDPCAEMRKTPAG